MLELVELNIEFLNSQAKTCLDFSTNNKEDEEVIGEEMKKENELYLKAAHLFANQAATLAINKRAKSLESNCAQCGFLLTPNKREMKLTQRKFYYKCLHCNYSKVILFVFINDCFFLFFFF